MRSLWLTLLVLMIAVLVPVGLQAETITVSNLNDDGAGSLRQAIADANDGDTIDFSVTGKITLTSGELTLDENLTIKGPGADQLTISGNNASRVFRINSGEPTTISDLTITDGNPGGNGGGIYNTADLLSLENCTISDNTAENLGGGIYNESGEVTLTGCTISGNTATKGEGDGHGGGIYSEGSLSLDDCTVSGNSANSGGGIYNDNLATLTNCSVSDNPATKGDDDSNGGGIANFGEMTLTGCTINGNSMINGNGGGIYNDGDLFLKNCTVSDNSAAKDEGDGSGGGLANVNGATVDHSTISGNSADSGGGISTRGDSSFYLKNTIISDNTSPDGADISVDNTIDSYGFNLIEDADVGDAGGSLNEVENPGTDITGQDPTLGPLQGNGGPTETHALLDGSLAFDAGSCTDISGNPVAEDQRGITRPQGATCDIGAYEVEEAAVSPPPGSTGSSGCGLNRSPVPDAGPDQTVCAEERVFLDGSRSHDPDEGIPPNTIMTVVTPQYVHQRRDDLRFQWSIAVLYYAAGRPILAVPYGADVHSTMGDFDSEIGSFIPNVAGAYQFDLFVTDDFGDKQSDRVTIFVVDCPQSDEWLPEDVFLFERFVVFPNPFHDQIHFGFVGEGQPEWILVTVFDLSGQQVWESRVEGMAEVAWDGIASDRSSLSSGPYLYRILLMAKGTQHSDTGIIFLK